MINWESINSKSDIKFFSYEDRICQGKVVKVYDGDTVHIVFPLTDNEPDRLFKWNCRLINIDTPEIRTKNLKEKEFGISVRNILRERILDKVVTVKCKDFDKYGRLLVEIFIEDENVNNWLIENNYAKRYDGGKKHKWFSDENKE
tara:strand:+ start:3880 stop:4314 length:435 start_codon:yes stop_codon:yes gene_type:complete